MHKHHGINQAINHSVICSREQCLCDDITLHHIAHLCIRRIVCIILLLASVDVFKQAYWSKLLYFGGVIASRLEGVRIDR